MRSELNTEQRRVLPWLAPSIDRSIELRLVDGKQRPLTRPDDGSSMSSSSSSRRSTTGAPEPSTRATALTQRDKCRATSASRPGQAPRRRRRRCPSRSVAGTHPGSPPCMPMENSSRCGSTTCKGRAGPGRRNSQDGRITIPGGGASATSWMRNTWTRRQAIAGPTCSPVAWGGATCAHPAGRTRAPIERRYI